jgi:dTDP-4-amino-4,6-dideoxygalactose transaminase
MRVPLNDLRRQSLEHAEELEAAIRRVLDSGWYILGREHDAFERDFAAYCQCREAVAVGNGTDALEIALRGLGCGPGDEVITAANAGGYTTAACLLVGATPVYADVDPHRLTLSPDSVASALRPRTKAVVVTHLYGMLGDVPGVRAAIAGQRVWIVEDCAQAHGGVRDGKRAGSLGDVATFSFYPTKNLGAIGDGGAIVTDDTELAQRLRQLRQYGWSSKYRSTLAGGRNSRLDEMQAAILRVKLPYLDGWNERRRQIAARYGEAVSGTSATLVHTPAGDYVAHLCVLRHPERDRLLRVLEEHGVGAAIHYPLLDTQQPSMANAAWRAVVLRHSEAAQREIVTLPCFAEMTDGEVDYVCETLRRAV